MAIACKHETASNCNSKLVLLICLLIIDQEACISCIILQIGEKVVALDEVTDEMVAQMTADEKETYTRLYQQAMSQTEYY